MLGCLNLLQRSLAQTPLHGNNRVGDMQQPPGAARSAHTLPRAPREAQPPGYDEVISSTRYPILRTSQSDPDIADRPGGSSSDRQAAPWKLKFVDFTPHLTASHDRRNLPTFEKLLDRANTWLRSNKHVEVTTCETITWCAEDARSLNDTDVVTCTLKRGNVKKLNFMRGVRIWFKPKTDSSDEHTTIRVREIVPDTLDTKSLENFDLKALVRKANNQVWERPISGCIVNIETVLQPSRADTTRDRLSVKTQDTYWSDGGKVCRRYIPVIRIFYVQGERNINVEIGVTDLVPRVVKKEGKSRYEDMESLMVRASEWIQHQPHVTVSNLQTLTFRRRGFGNGVGLPVFWASTDSEDAGIRVLRIAYTKPRTMVTLRVIRAHRFCVRKRTFAPRRSLISARPGTRGKQPDELKYQSFTKTVDEVSHWLHTTGVDVLSVETLRHQVHDGRYHTSPDASLVRPSDDKTREFITLTRVFFKASASSRFSLSGPSSLFNNPQDRPFWSRPTNPSVIRRSHAHRWRHVLLVIVITVAIFMVAVVIVLVLAVARGWL